MTRPTSRSATRQRVWLRCEGEADNGSRVIITLDTASEVLASEVSDGLSKVIPRAELEKLRDGSALNIVLPVTFDQTATQTNAVDFPLRTYHIVLTYFEHYTSFTNGDFNGGSSSGSVIRNEDGNDYCETSLMVLERTP